MWKLRTLAGAIAIVGSQAFAADLTVETAQGTASVPSNPSTIVALDIAAIDTLDALGVEVAGVPTPHFVAYLDEAIGSATKVGSLFEPDFEALANLAPDLIVAGGRSSKQVGPLSEIAPTVDMTIWGEDHIGQSLARLETYGMLTGKEAEAAALEAAFNDKLNAAKDVVEGKGNALIVLTSGPKVSAYGADSRFGWLHEAIGIPEAVEDVTAQTHGEAISFEFIAEANPDWLIVVDRSSAIGKEGVGAAETLDNALVQGTTAWSKGQVIYLNSGPIYIAGGGIQSMSGTLDEIIAAFAGGA